MDKRTHDAGRKIRRAIKAIIYARSSACIICGEQLNTYKGTVLHPMQGYGHYNIHNLHLAHKECCGLNESGVRLLMER